MALYQATIDDKPYIMALYTEAIGSEGCTWRIQRGQSVLHH